MVGAFVVKTASEEARVAAIGVHAPDGRRTTGLCTAENDVLAVGGFGGAKIPDGRVALGEAREVPIARIKTTDLGAALGETRLEVAIEMIRVRTLRLEF